MSFFWGLEAISTNLFAAVLPALKKFTVEEADEEVSGMIDPSLQVP